MLQSSSNNFAYGLMAYSHNTIFHKFFEMLMLLSTIYSIEDAGNYQYSEQEMNFVSSRRGMSAIGTPEQVYELSFSHWLIALAMLG